MLTSVTLENDANLILDSKQVGEGNNLQVSAVHLFPISSSIEQLPEYRQSYSTKCVLIPAEGVRQKRWIRSIYPPCLNLPTS
jgi:hypothetical protein